MPGGCATSETPKIAAISATARPTRMRTISSCAAWRSSTSSLFSPARRRTMRRGLCINRRKQSTPTTRRQSPAWLPIIFMNASLDTEIPGPTTTPKYLVRQTERSRSSDYDRPFDAKAGYLSLSGRYDEAIRAANAASPSIRTIRVPRFTNGCGNISRPFRRGEIRRATGDEVEPARSAHDGASNTESRSTRAIIITGSTQPRRFLRAFGQNGRGRLRHSCWPPPSQQVKSERH